jgi:1,4-dihydroxy-2-naphthoate octaprenyltransferase
MNKKENRAFLASISLTVVAGLALVLSFSFTKPNPFLFVFGVLAFLMGLVLAVRSAYLATQPVKKSDTANGD